MSLIGALLLAVLLAAGWAIFADRGPLTSLRRQDVSEFAATYDFPVNAVNGHFVVAYLVRSMRWRRWGAFVGLVAGIVVAAIRTKTVVQRVVSVGSDGGVITSTSSRTEATVGWLLLAVAGFFVGALVAEVRGGATATGPRRSALLAPRQLSDFVDERLLRPVYLIAVAAVGIFALTVVRGGLSSLRGKTVAFAAAAIAVALVIDSVSRWLVRRPCPVLAPDLANAMDAVRISALRRVARIGLALSWGLLAWEAASASDAVPRPLHTADLLLALYAGWSCLRTGARLRKKSWALRQPRAARP
jgi:hypothetical protein